MDKLKFFGCGSGFNPAMGSTSAYFIEDNTLFLLDFGDGSYRYAKELNTLDSIDTVNLFVTHTHSDHIGSIGNLMLECKHVRHIAFNLICSPDLDHFQDIVNVLNAFGGRGFFSVIDPNTIDRLYKSFNMVRYVATQHSNDLPAYSLVFYTNDGAVYYSGDSATMGFAEELILGGAKISALYFDVTSKTESDCHLPITTLFQLLPKEFRGRTYCMHFNDQKCIDMAKSMGFNVVSPE